MTDVEQCPECKQWFTVQESRMGVPGGKEREPVDCPHCRAIVRQAMTDGFWRTYPADAPEQ
jgi:predicted Zn finger-like uncharacterized protein